jgi:TolB-like protein
MLMQLTEIQIGRFTLEPFRQLLLNGKPIVLGRKAVSILSVLAQADGAPVTKGELMEAVWPGLIVEENAIQVHIGALRRALGGSGAGLITIRGLGYRLDVSATENSNSDDASANNSVAVLNFVNMTGDPNLDHLGEGLVEELINRLSSYPNLKVPSRTSSFAYRDRHIDARQISSELGVAFLIEGSVRVSGDIMRVTAQLISSQDGNHIWSDNFDHEIGDLLDLQHELACSITDAVLPYLYSEVSFDEQPNVAVRQFIGGTSTDF